MFGDIYDRISARGRTRTARPVGAPAQGAVNLDVQGGPTPPPGLALSSAEARRFNEVARSQGFRDYQTMLAFERSRQQAVGPNAMGQVLTPENVRAAQMWHPRRLLEYVSDRYRAATGN